MTNIDITKYQTVEKMRMRIQSSLILDRLIKHAEGILKSPEGKSIGLTQTQCMVSIRLISKILPDLQSVQVEHNINHKQLSVHELNGRLKALGYEPNDVWKQLNPGMGTPAIEHRADTVDVQDPVEETTLEAIDKGIIRAKALKQAKAQTEREEKNVKRTMLARKKQRKKRALEAINRDRKKHLVTSGKEKGATPK